MLKKIVLFLSLLSLLHCVSPSPSAANFHQYWYEQGAEINRFELQQARYGELRKGEMTMIFVTEPFNVVQQVKSDTSKGKEVKNVLKLNLTRDFNTGVYPYSTMTSVFTEIDAPGLPVKVTVSATEWCGMVYHQLNRQPDKWLSRHFSYFQSEGDRQIELERVFSEDGILNLIRLNPKELPEGNFKVIPSLLFLRLLHRELKAYQASAVASPGKYKLVYPQLNRELVIRYQVNFPHRIESLAETRFDGFGSKKRKLTTKAKNVMVRMMPYWEKNALKDKKLRKEMGYGLD